MRRYWTTVEIRKLREIYADMDNGQVGVVLGRTWSAVQNMAVKQGLHKSAVFMASPLCRFHKGNRPWNVGRKGWQSGGKSKDTHFQPGNRPHNWMPVWSERITRDGIEVKVAEPSEWIPRPRLVWEQNFGPIPAGAIVRLRDGDKLNCEPSNLLLITRAEHARLNYRPRYRVKPPAAWTAPVRLAA